MPSPDEGLNWRFLLALAFGLCLAGRFWYEVIRWLWR